MAKTRILRTRIDPDQKAAAENILRRLGVSPTQAISMFYAQIIQQKGLPFSVTLRKTDRIPDGAAGVPEAWKHLDDTDFSHLEKR
jgi:addiction module RelB/DinJ family antitoxin